MSRVKKTKIRFIITSIMAIIVIAAILFLTKPVLKTIYPTPYLDAVTKYSKMYNLDKYLVYAIMKTESKFDESAVSNKGAVGLMQIQGNTAKWISKMSKIPFESDEKLMDPETNIKMGCWYISDLLDEFNQDTTTALAAYNAGRGNVANWLLNYEYSRNGKKLNKIPFKETSDYLERVMRSYQGYQKLYNSKFGL